MLFRSEIEKAYHDVFNVLLQILDDGRLTDAQGRTVDFKNTVIIMTSNAGSPLILEAASEGAVDPAAWARTEEQVIGVLRQQFRPEFLNRVDDIIVFHPLSADDIGAIVNIQLTRMEKLLADRKLTLELTPEARALIGREGYDPAFGARPLKRAIQRLLQNPLALAVLEGSYVEGDRIRAVPFGDVLRFEKA